jgi:hypothetical protein
MGENTLPRRELLWHHYTSHVRLGIPASAAIIAAVAMNGDAEREGKGREDLSHWYWLASAEGMARYWNNSLPLYRLTSVKGVPFDCGREIPGNGSKYFPCKSRALQWPEYHIMMYNYSVVYNLHVLYGNLIILNNMQKREQWQSNWFELNNKRKKRAQKT